MPAVQKIGIHQVAPTLAATLPSGWSLRLTDEHGLLVVDELRCRRRGLVSSCRDAAVADGAREGLVRGSMPAHDAAASRRSLQRRCELVGVASRVLCRKRAWRGVVVALHGLQVVALQTELGDVAVALGQLRPLELREGRLLVRRAHVGPDQVAAVSTQG